MPRHNAPSVEGPVSVTDCSFRLFFVGSLGYDSVYLEKLAAILEFERATGIFPNGPIRRGLPTIDTMNMCRRINLSEHWTFDDDELIVCT